MANKTQLQWIKEKLLRDGEISRNYCLSLFCSRLGARISDLKKEGWVFYTERRNGDYVYILIHSPESLVQKVLPEFAKENTKA